MKRDKPLIVITGSGGQVGYELERILCLLGNVIAVNQLQLDFLNEDAIVSFMRAHKPDIVVNTAAYTMVDKAEENEKQAMKVNGIAPGLIASELKKNGGLMVHFSTDYVFDGEKHSPYNESDAVNPLSVYAKSKLAGDMAVMQSGAKHLIFRTGWIYSARGRNFLLTMLNLCEQWQDLRVVNDQFGAPTWARTIAEGVGLILSKKKAFDPECSGLYNMTSKGQITWYEFAVQISKFYEYKTKRRVSVFPVSTGEYPMKAVRPKYAVLDNQKLKNIFNITLPDWTVPFRQVMLDLGYSNPALHSVFKNKHGIS